MSKRKRTFLDELIAAIRKAERGGLTRYRLSMLTGINQATLSHLIRGRATPRVDTAERIAAALGYRITLTKSEST